MAGNNPDNEDKGSLEVLVEAPNEDEIVARIKLGGDTLEVHDTESRDLHGNGY